MSGENMNIIFKKPVKNKILFRLLDEGTYFVTQNNNLAIKADTTKAFLLADAEGVPINKIIVLSAGHEVQRVLPEVEKIEF